MTFLRIVDPAGLAWAVPLAATGSTHFWVAAVSLVVAALSGGATLWLVQRERRHAAERNARSLALEREIATRRSTEDSLRRANQLLEQTLSSMHDALFVTDAGGTKILKCNRAVATVFGIPLERFLQTPPARLHADAAVHAGFRQRVCEAAVRQGFFSGEILFQHNDGHAMTAEATVTPIRDERGTFISWVHVVRDVTARIEAGRALASSERRLRQAEKMEAIGTLAGGIAHDLNNMLTPILGYAAFMAGDTSRSPEDRSYLDQIQRAAQRARDLVRQILSFSRDHEPVSHPIHMAPVVREAMQLIGPTIPSNIEVRCTLNAERDLVLGDPVQVQQILMNLCGNSVQAMQPRGGVLTIALSEHCGPVANPVAGTQVGDTVSCVCLRVTDTGCGIDPALRDRIFEPFFTTKKGDGTGMGLAVIHGIVKRSHGAITVDSRPDAGTTVAIYLPITTAAPALETAATTPTAAATTRIVRERILLVDDEEMVARMTARVLENLGYQVESFTNSMDALSAFQRNPLHYDLAITDQTMPGMMGDQLSQRMLSLRPDLPIILCTGFSETITWERARALGIAEYMLKPFLPQEMGAVIRRTLASRRAAAATPSQPGATPVGAPPPAASATATPAAPSPSAASRTVSSPHPRPMHPPPPQQRMSTPVPPAGPRKAPAPPRPLDGV